MASPVFPLPLGPCTLVLLQLNMEKNALDIFIGLHRLKLLLEFLTAFYLQRIGIDIREGGGNGKNEPVTTGKTETPNRWEIKDANEWLTVSAISSKSKGATCTISSSFQPSNIMKRLSSEEMSAGWYSSSGSVSSDNELASSLPDWDLFHPSSESAGVEDKLPSVLPNSDD